MDFKTEVEPAGSADDSGDEVRPTRVQVDLYSNAMSRLKLVKKLIQASTHTETIKYCLKVAEIILLIYKNGGRLVEIRKDGTQIDLDRYLRQ